MKYSIMAVRMLVVCAMAVSGVMPCQADEQLLAAAKQDMTKALQNMVEPIGEPVNFGVVAEEVKRASERLSTMAMGFDDYTKLQKVESSGVTRSVNLREIYAREADGRYSADESKYVKIETAAKGPVTSLTLDVPRNRRGGGILGGLGLNKRGARSVYVKSVKIEYVVAGEPKVIDKPDFNTWIDGNVEKLGQETVVINLCEGMTAKFAEQAQATIMCVGLDPDRSALTCSWERVKVVEYQNEKEACLPYVKWALRQASREMERNKPNGGKVFTWLRDAACYYSQLLNDNHSDASNDNGNVTTSSDSDTDTDTDDDGNGDNN